MNVVILTPEKKAYEGTAQSVKVPGAGGDFEVLQNHAPIVSALTSGTVRVQAEGGQVTQFHILSGFVEVLNNNISILAQGLQAQ